MNLDDFKSDWKQRHNELAQDRFDELASEVVARTAKLEAAILRRDLLETLAAVVVVMFFGVFLWFDSVPALMKIGIVIIMLGVIEIVAVLSWTRRRDDRPSHDAPLLDYCKAEKARVDRQIQLVRNVTWWYSGPILLGCCVMMYGLLSSVPELSRLIFYGFLASFYACFLAAGIIIHRGNSRSARKDFIPIRDELAELVRSLEDGVSENGSKCSDS